MKNYYEAAAGGGKTKNSYTVYQMYQIFKNRVNLENFSEFLLYGYSEKRRIPLISLWIFPSLCRYSIACSKSRNMQPIDISSSGGPDWSCRSKCSVSFKKSICNIAFFVVMNNIIDERSRLKHT